VQNSQKVGTPQEKEEYSVYQEELAFQKELNILRNDYYYKMIDSQGITLVDFLYQPLDTLSGDAYTVRIVDEHRTFYLLVDGMGKGLSASLTAMSVTIFINHIIDKMIEHESFSLDIIIKESMDYMKPLLLDEEVLSIDYILFDSYFAQLEYAKFSMPPFLLEDDKKNIIKIKSNNPPMNKWNDSYQIDRCSVQNINKFLFYSDGMVENSTEDGFVYNKYIEDDFLNAYTREDIKQSFLSKIATQEDDRTFIFINKLQLDEHTLIHNISFETTLDAVRKANEWYQHLYGEETASIAFNELFMNAYEHGNLGLDTQTKHKLLEDDIYFESLLEYEKTCKKRITVEIYKIQHLQNSYIITKIIDEGEGFDTKMLSDIFRHSQKFNGRGVYLSRKNSMGIYYNNKGNSVLFLNKL